MQLLEELCGQWSGRFSGNTEGDILLEVDNCSGSSTSSGGLRVIRYNDSSIPDAGIPASWLAEVKLNLNATCDGLVEGTISALQYLSRIARAGHPDPP
jgi:hypothetical protein